MQESRFIMLFFYNFLSIFDKELKLEFSEKFEFNAKTGSGLHIYTGTIEQGIQFEHIIYNILKLIVLL